MLQYGKGGMFMDISMDMANLQSVKQALGMANMRRAMNQDAQSVATLMQSMQETSAKTMELSVTPHLGKNIDISI
jgi:Xaa-Pro aminopeptidase